MARTNTSPDTAPSAPHTALAGPAPAAVSPAVGVHAALAANPRQRGRRHRRRRRVLSGAQDSDVGEFLRRQGSRCGGWRAACG
jgi:hypothetical protein